MQSIFDESLAASIAAQKAVAGQYRVTILKVAEQIASVLKGGNKILLFGNGGSAADAQHLAAEFVNRFLIDRPPLAALALTTDTSILTSVGNDFSYNDIFSKQILALGKKGDIALGISTSGNSQNVINGLDVARQNGLLTVALTGKGGGRMINSADFHIDVPSSHTPAIQEAHLWVEHLLCQLVDHILFEQGES